MSKKTEEKIIKETKYCKIINQGKVGEGEYTYSIEKIYILKVLIAVRIVIKTFSIVGR